MGKLVCNGHPIVIIPELAAALGLHEAILLQQIHYWLKTKPHEYEGRMWVYNTYEQWHEQLLFLTPKQIRNAIDNLEGKGLLTHGHHNKKGYDRTKWYTIEYPKLSEYGTLELPSAPQGKSICPPGRKELPHRAKASALQGTSICPPGQTNTIDSTETNTETNTEKVPTPVGCAWCLRPRSETVGTPYLLQQVHDRYKAQFGDCPNMNPAKDGELLRKLLASGKPAEAILAVYTKYLSIEDDWFAQHGYDVGTFYRQYDGIKLRKVNTDGQPQQRYGRRTGREPAVDADYARQLEEA